MSDENGNNRLAVAAESVWLDQNFFDDEILEKRLSPAAAIKSGVKHIAIESDDPKLQWLADSSDLGLLYHATLHSIFMRWAVAVNGLEVAAKHYASWDDKKAFQINGYRVGKESIVAVPLHQYPGSIASELHAGTGQMLAGWAFCSMFSCVEEMIFLLYRLYYNHSPRNLIQEFPDLKKLYKDSSNSEEDLKKWKEALAERFDAWRIKKGYAGIEKIFNGYLVVAKLQTTYASMAPASSWGKTLTIIAEIRNCFVHGAKAVSKKLGDLCASPECFGFSFNEGDPFRIDMNDLALLEMFLDEFTTMLNHAFHDTFAEAKGLKLKDVFKDRTPPTKQ